MTATAKDFKKIYDLFGSSISQKYDCGRMCAPLNKGEPVSCSTQHAVPIVTTEELKLLNARTDMWRKFKPYDAATREIVEDMASQCRAVECRGARHCERDNRSLACRAFPFFPYYTREKEVVGLAYYWAFEDRCWVISNLKIVERQFVREMIEGYKLLCDRDEDERDAFIEESANMRRVFSRFRRPIPIVGRDGGFFKVLPKSGGKIVPAKIEEFKPLGPFKSDRAYRAEIRACGGDPEGKTLTPNWRIKNWWAEA